MIRNNGMSSNPGSNIGITAAAADGHVTKYHHCYIYDKFFARPHTSCCIERINMAYGIPPQNLRLIRRILDEEQEDDEAALAVLLAYRRRRRRQRRRFWVRPWIARRPQFGQYHQLMGELEREAQGDFTNFLRMEPAMFYELLQRVSPRLTKAVTNFRRPLEPGLKLAITLRFLATGNSYRSLAYSFRVPHNTISTFVGDVCEAIIAEYGAEVVTLPDTEEGWLEVSNNFGTRWNFHNAIGAIDGKHIAIKAPSNSGSLYHNYKGFFSIILLGVVDADCKFMWADVGANGSTSDCAVFNQSALRTALEDNTLGLPPPRPLPGDDTPLPFFLIGDDAFPLREWMMKPYSSRQLSEEERIFNYRLSRARRIVENAFGILANRFRCLLTTMQQDLENVKSIVLACICLHNVMRIRYPGLQNALMDREVDNQLVPGAWRQEQLFQEIAAVVGPTSESRRGKRQRLLLKHYYNSAVGSVPWQRDML